MEREQQIRKILYKSNYKINETPKYELVELINGGEQDKSPITPTNVVKEAGEENPETITPNDTPQPEEPQTTPEEPIIAPQQPIEQPIVAPEPLQSSLDDVQNDIIRMII